MIEKFDTSAMTASTLSGNWNNSQVDIRESLRKVGEIMKSRIGRDNSMDFQAVVGTLQAVDYLKSKINRGCAPGSTGMPAPLTSFMGTPILTGKDEVEVNKIAWEIAREGKRVLILEMKDGEFEAKLFRLPKLPDPLPKMNAFNETYYCF
jgi:hypothetical protein